MQAAIDEVLEQDDDLSAMYLSEGAVRARSRDDHQEVEMLLESFSKQVEEIVNEVDSLVVSSFFRVCVCVCFERGYNH